VMIQGYAFQLSNGRFESLFFPMLHKKNSCQAPAFLTRLGSRSNRTMIYSENELLRTDNAAVGEIPGAIAESIQRKTDFISLSLKPQSRP